MNAIDGALQSTIPTVMVPRYAELEELSTPGRRILMAGNGVWLEVFREWMYLRTQIALPLPVAVPYGNVSAEVRMKFGKHPKAMVAQFIEEARARMPNECAGWIIWDENTGAWRLHMLQELSVDRDHVNMILPVLGESEHLVIDIHSHGETAAFFSSTDNKDDRSGSHISGVVGSLDQASVTAEFRICAEGMFVPLHF